MGQVSDDMIEGECCSHCGEYFTTGHGYPVLCWECYDSESDIERGDVQRATFRKLWKVE